MVSRQPIPAATSILELLTEADPAIERSNVKRVLTEAMRAWPGDTENYWWKWLSEAARSLGIRSKTLDCTLDEACSLVRDGAKIACYRHDEEDNEGHWLAIFGRYGRKLNVFSTQQATSHAVSEAEVWSMLANFSRKDSFRCVVFQPTETALTSKFGNDNAKGYTPIRRLWLLLKPELSDVWMVVIFAFFVSLLMLATPIAVEALVNTVAFGRFLQPIVVLALILLAFLSVQGAIRALQTYVVEIVQRRLFARVAGDLAFRLPRTEAEATDGTYPPELVNRFFDIVAVQKVVAQLLLDGIGLILSTVIGMAVLGFYHPWLLGFDLFLLAAIAVIILVLGRGAVASAVKESKHKYYMASWLEDLARCPTAFRNDGGAEFALERADRLIHEYLDARRHHFRILMRQILFALGLQAIASTVLLGLGGWLVVAGELTLGQLVAAELIVTVIVGSFAKLGKHMEGFYDLLASVDKLGVLFDIPTERQDGILSIESSNPVSVKLNTVSYGWPGKRPVIQDLSAEIGSGERVAFLGEAGTGKSLLASLLSGLRDPTSGHLAIDGFDPRNLRPDILRKRIAMAGQGEVFHATVEENVHLHRPDVTATEVRNALDNVGLLEAVLHFKNGVDTVLSSSGAPLSNSQQRMLDIARATVGRPGLLLIDGSLDVMGEHDIDRCLSFLLADDAPWTLIVMTSREDIANRVGRVISLSSLSGVL